MSSAKQNQKKSRNQRRRDRRRERHLTPKERMDVSTDALNHFEEMMDPTERDIAEVKYEHIVADPAGAELCGVPMALGGVPPTSVKVRMRLAKTMAASGSGNISIAFYNCSGPSDTAGAQSPDNVQNLVDSLGNTLPKFGIRETTPGVYITDYYPPTVVGGYFESGIPVLGDSSATPLPGSNSITVPNPGLTLLGGTGRLVAQEVEIYPVGPLLTTKGLGYTVVLNETSSNALNGQNHESAYQLQNTQRHSFPLSNWDPSHVIRAVRVPMAQSDVNLLPTDYTNYTAAPGSFTKTYWQRTGEVWGGFFGTGLDAGQSFRVETTLVYEFVASGYAMATQNNTVTGSGPEMLTGLKQHLPAGVYGREQLELNKAGAIGHAMVEQHGPKHAAGLASVLTKIGGKVGQVAEAVLPQLLGAALTAGTEGIVPPQVGNLLGREAFTLVNSLSGAPRESLGHTPMIAPAPSDWQGPVTSPSHIEEVDFVQLGDTPRKGKGEGIPALPESPDDATETSSDCSCTTCRRK